MPDSASVSADILRRRAAPAAGVSTAFLVFDTESVPDGDLLRRVKYPDGDLTPEQAVERARQEARDNSKDGSDFVPVTFQTPVAVCVLRVGGDFLPQALACLDAPQYRTPEIVKQFWRGVSFYPRAKLVTFNGRGFDLPLLELAAFDHGCPARDYFANSRNRYQGNHLDLMEWLTNFRAFPMVGGLDLMAKRGPRPAGVGKLEVSGDQVYEMHKAGRLREVNDYCMFDTLDTYFVFLRTRVLMGEVSSEEEQGLARRARNWLGAKVEELPALRQYLEIQERL
jgi:predicted PolB exonuclease-like 3'-5' exonuclease